MSTRQSIVRALNTCSFDAGANTSHSTSFLAPNFLSDQSCQIEAAEVVLRDPNVSAELSSAAGQTLRNKTVMVDGAAGHSPGRPSQ